VVFATSAARVPYPYENEWLEGGTLLHVHRILNGEEIYCQPSYAFVAYPYGPVYFYACAALSAIIGLGFTPLRLVSLAASAGTVLLIFLLVKSRSRRLDVALIAAGLYAATYVLSGTWFEVARVDALFLFFFIAAAFLLGTRSARWPDVAAGLLLALSCLTKQTLAVLAGPLMLWLAVEDWRRALRVGATAAAAFAAGTALSMVASDGWYWYYVVTLPSRHGLFDRSDLWFYLRFWWEDILRPLPILALLVGALTVTRLVARQTRRAVMFELSLLVGALAVSWVGRLNVGFDNVLMPAYAGLAIVLGLGLGWLLGEGRVMGPRPVALTVPVALGLVIAQLVALRFDPRQCLPSDADRQAGQALVEKLADMPGEVVVSAHPYLLLLAGKPTHAHQAAFMTFLGGFGGGTDALGRAVLDEMAGDIAAKRYSAIILDGPSKPGASSWFVPLEGHYRLAGEVFDDPEVFMPVTGAPRQPRYILVPVSDPAAPPEP